MLARRLGERGDPTWRVPLPSHLLSPAAQTAIIDEVLAEGAQATASAEGWRLPWVRTTLGSWVAVAAEPLALFVDRVEPERVTGGFLPARVCALEESRATITFRGANLLILTADGARVSFRLRGRGCRGGRALSAPRRRARTRRREGAEGIGSRGCGRRCTPRRPGSAGAPPTWSTRRARRRRSRRPGTGT